jgi:phage-related protein (TIGR01555 family)
MPNMLKPAYAFGGVSMTQLCKPYVDNWLRARQSGSDLLNSFSTMVLKTNMEEVLAGGGGVDLWRRVDFFNKTRSNRGTFVVDKNEEDFSNVSAPISGLDKMVAQAQEQMSSVSGIPLVVLLGITPSGLNASSEGEIRVFYDAILSYLERVCRPCLETLLDVIQLSLFGDIDQTMKFEFVPLWEMSDKDKADIRKSDAEADTAYINGGVVSPEEARLRLQSDETSLYHGVDLSGPPPEPEQEEADEEFPGLGDEREAA